MEQPTNPYKHQQNQNNSIQQQQNMNLQQSNGNFSQQSPNNNFQQQQSNSFLSQQSNQNLSQQQFYQSNSQQNTSNPNFQQQSQNFGCSQQSNVNMQQQPSNQNFQQNSQNINLQQQQNSSFFQQHPSNSNFQQQQNTNVQQQLSNQNFQQQSSNPNFQQQPSNQSFQQQPSNQNFQQQQNNSNMQSHSFNPHPQNVNAHQQPSNQNFNQQPSNQSFQQQPSNQSFQQQPQNASFQQQPQNSSFQQQPSNQSFQQQPQNASFQQQPSNQSFQQKLSNQSFQQTSVFIPKTSQNDSQMKPKTFAKTQGFVVIYNNTKFLVDPISLMNSSLKFKELIQPYIQDYEEMKKLHLEITGAQLTNRNIHNFLLICQKQRTDVQNSEMKDICEIAKMFKAEDIYNTGLKFIQEKLDPDFSVPDNKYDGSDGVTYLKLVGDSSTINNDSNLGEEQEETCNETEAENDKDKETDEDEENDKSKKESMKSVLYLLRVENHTFKCPIFKFVNENRIIFSAKQKYNEIFIGEGDDIHIRKKVKHIGHITQNQGGKYNDVSLRDAQFKLNYVNTAILGHHSIDVSFPFEGDTEHWVPRNPKFDPKENKYYLNLDGAYHHATLQSARNLVLQNTKGHLTYIVRKVDQNVYEIECNYKLDPLIAFAIALSDIVGPYDDPWKNHESYEL
ncbi:hypothetical protein M9Y10_040264 [Tritrichomonas musculus]|uniref:Tubby C-terminal domain-containing protein n=1 Tax=Tritrichomonas musculus TaxID=1915356 RepID=A0ABR2GPT5_9EUKA